MNEAAFVSLASRMRATGNGCVTVGSRNGSGYSVLRKKGKKRRLAHRVIWERAVGPIPSGMVIDHVCRNRACVNPKHLRLVTPRQNCLENSLSLQAQNAKKTHCHRGHPLSGANLGVNRIGRIYTWRYCVECQRVAHEKIKANKRLA